MAGMFDRYTDEDLYSDSSERQEPVVVEIAGCLVKSTVRAVLWATGEREVWIPKSVITDESLDERGAGTIFVKEWFVEKEKLV